MKSILRACVRTLGAIGRALLRAKASADAGGAIWSTKTSSHVSRWWWWNQEWIEVTWLLYWVVRREQSRQHESEFARTLHQAYGGLYIERKYGRRKARVRSWRALAERLTPEHAINVTMSDNSHRRR